MSPRLALLTLALAAICLAGDRPPLAPEAADFIKWYATWKVGFNPGEVLKAYGERLAKDGVAPEEVERRMAIINAAVRAMPPEFTAVHFNKIYTTPNAPFRQEPSQFLVRIAETLKPGDALDVAMGQGRNSVYLASKGWNVTGYDLSDEGMRIAQDAAKKAGLSIRTIKASHDEFDLGKSRWDLIVQTFAFTNLSDDAYRQRLFDALKPGGVLLIEGFGGKSDNLVLRGFLGLHIVYYEDREDIADWSMQKARMTRIAVRKE